MGLTIIIFCVIALIGNVCSRAGFLGFLVLCFGLFLIIGLPVMLSEAKKAGFDPDKMNASDSNAGNPDKGDSK